MVVCEKLHMHVIVYGCVWEFQDEILWGGGKNVKPGKNRIFLKNGKTVNCRNNTGCKL